MKNKDLINLKGGDVDIECEGEQWLINFNCLCDGEWYYDNCGEVASCCS